MLKLRCRTSVGCMKQMFLFDRVYQVYSDEMGPFIYNHNGRSYYVEETSEDSCIWKIVGDDNNALFIEEY